MQCWHLLSEPVNFGSDKYTKYHWCETSLLSQAVLKHVVSKDFILKKSVQGRNLWPCSISCHVTVLLKRKLQHVGHIRIALNVG